MNGNEDVIDFGKGSKDVAFYDKGNDNGQELHEEEPADAGDQPCASTTEGLALRPQGPGTLTDIVVLAASSARTRKAHIVS